MAEFGLLKSFDIDDDQLDGLSPQECFVLGYELAMVDRLLEGDEELHQLAHAKNRERLEKACADAKRECRVEWMSEDPSEDWIMLHVQPRPKSPQPS